MVCKLCHATTHAKSAHELIEKLASDPTQQRLKSFNRLSEEKREEYAALQTEDGNTMLLVLVFGLGKSVPTETHVEVAKTLIDLGVDIGDKSGGKTAAQIFKVNQTEPDEGSKGRIFYDQLLAILNGETPPPTPAPSAASAAPAPVEAKKKVESTESSSGDIKTTEKAATTIAASKKPAQASTSEIQSSAGSEVKSSPKKAAKPSSKIAASAASGGKKKSSDELPSNIVVAEQPPTDVPELPSFTEAVPAKKIPAKKATTSPPQATKKVAAPPAATNSPPQATKNANTAANKKAQAGQAGGAKPRAKPTTTA